MKRLSPQRGFESGDRGTNQAEETRPAQVRASTKPWPCVASSCKSAVGPFPLGHPVKEQLKVALSEARSLWFLCSGNVVRSAFAEIYARHKGCSIPVRSAATRFRNEAIFDETVKELTARGIGRVAIERFETMHLDEVAREFHAEDVVLGMTQDHVQDVIGHIDTPRELEQRAFLLGDAFWTSEEIADPVLDGADFGRTFERIAKAIDSVLLQLKKGPRRVVR